ILLDTADDDGDKLRINAYAAVRKALSKSNNPPQIRIVSPTNGLSEYAGFWGLTFDAEVKDFEDGPGGVTVEWVSDRDGPIGQGTNFTGALKTLGAHHITATARDKSGATNQAAVDITLADTTPTAQILAPTWGQSVERGKYVALNGQVLQNF